MTDSQATATDRATDGHATASNREATGQPTGVTIADAAKRLGLSTDAVRSRLHRGTLLGVKTADGVWLVFLDEPPVDQPGTDRAATAPPTASNRADDGPATATTTVDPTAVIAAKDETIAVLREQVRSLQSTVDAQAIAVNQLQGMLGQAMRSLTAGPSRVIDGDTATSTEFEASRGSGEAMQRDRQSETLNASQGTTTRSWWRRALGLS
jgi:hypothetical protein